MVLKVYTDGGSRGNPGPAAIGVAFYIGVEPIFTYREDIGIATNNDAEYTALIRALEKIKEQREKIKDAEKIEVRSDSSLIINQVRGFFKVKQGKIKEYIFKIRTLEQEIGLPVSYHLIPREENRVADALVKNKEII
ncbi:ribonuclease HI family protein [Candidatus Roizmanbacteria bacterium]|nr:ribonuclease HI family protein [Candidatus Roizmanbacteria bacterium]